MATTDTPTFEQIRTLAARLPRHARAELIAWLAQDLAATPPVESHQPSAHNGATWAQLRAELQASFAALDADVPTAGEQLERDRSERQAALEGSGHVHS